MIFYIDESGTRAFDDGDDLMASLGNKRPGINFVMVDGQGTLIGIGSDDTSLMKSMQLVVKTKKLFKNLANSMQKTMYFKYRHHNG